MDKIMKQAINMLLIACISMTPTLSLPVLALEANTSASTGIDEKNDGYDDLEENNDETRHLISGSDAAMTEKDDRMPSVSGSEIITDQVADSHVFFDNSNNVENSEQYLPYEGAKYQLLYSVNGDEITIEGIIGYNDKNELGKLVIPDNINPTINHKSSTTQCFVM